VTTAAQLASERIEPAPLAAKVAAVTVVAALAAKVAAVTVVAAEGGWRRW
jgi:hypothetical protein